MGIYLPKMEMPKEGCYHRICIYPDGTVPIEGGMYEAIPVPPHGRLADVDELEKEAQKRMLICDKNDNQFQKPYEIMRAIALAPTIIPADGKDTDVTT